MKKQQKCHIEPLADLFVLKEECKRVSDEVLNDIRERAPLGPNTGSANIEALVPTENSDPTEEV